MISRFTRRIIAGLILMSWLGFYNCLAQTEGIIIDEIISKVDNHIILKSELELAYLDMITRGESVNSDSKCRVLEALIVNKLLLAKAETDSIIVLDIEVENSLDRKLRYFIAQIGSEEKLEEYYDKSIEEFKEDLRDKEKEQLLIVRMQDNITSRIVITPSEIRDFFNKIPKDSLPYFSKQVTVGQIVKYTKAGTQRVNEAKDKLSALKQLILSGESFGNLAARYSMEPGADRSGGRLGFFRKGELAPEYEATALALSVGEISDPVQTDFGIHLIQLLERRGNEYDTQHILIIPEPSEDDIQNTFHLLDSIYSLINHDSISFDKAAKEFSDDKISSANGGFLMDRSGSSKMSVEMLDPNTFFTLDTMKLGSLSRPMIYDFDGKSGVRIIYYKDAMKPHIASLNDDWQKISDAALNEKRGLILNSWFGDAKHDVFIDIDEEYINCNILN